MYSDFSISTCLRWAHWISARGRSTVCRMGNAAARRSCPNPSEWATTNAIDAIGALRDAWGTRLLFTSQCQVLPAVHRWRWRRPPLKPPKSAVFFSRKIHRWTLAEYLAEPVRCKWSCFERELWFRELTRGVKAENGRGLAPHQSNEPAGCLTLGTCWSSRGPPDSSHRSVRFPWSRKNFVFF